MDTKKLTEVDVVIVGGGINGCGLIRDLALNGVSTLLLEKGDFSSQTSQSSSKMLHGGIRYLENLDFALVQEALEEKNLWLKLAPHICYEKEFIIPLYTYSKFKPWMMKIGLFVYDFLSHFKNKPHSMLTKEETISAVPSLSSQGLLGAGKYYDAIVDDAKLSLECLYDALLEPNTHAENYHEVIKVDDSQGKKRITYKNLLSGEIKEVLASYVVYSTGPFTDKLLPSLGINWSPKMKLSKGIHLWLKKDTLTNDEAVVLTTRDGRVVFVIPQRDAILLGTTESPVNEEIFNIKANEDEIDYLINVFNEYFDQRKISKEHIISSYAGVRPLVKDENAGGDLGKVSRHHKVFRPDNQSYVILGGKYTTFRTMVQDIAKEIVPRLGKSYNPQLTLNPLRQKSIKGTFDKNQNIDQEEIQQILNIERVKTKEDLLRRRLSHIEDLDALHDKIKDFKIDNLIQSSTEGQQLF